MQMFELFRLEAQTQVRRLTSGVLALERNPSAVEPLDTCVCAARSFKGAAHMAGVRAGVDLAGAMEHCFAAALRGEIELQPEQINLMLQGVGLLDSIAKLGGGATSPGAASRSPQGELPRRASPPETTELQAGHCAVAQPATVRLPDEARQYRERGASGRRKRVLVVDDSLEVRELQYKLLSYRGYEVTIAVDGVDGWNAIRNESFDLVLTDIDMPLVDGIRLLRLIRNDPRFALLPVLVVCGEDCEQERWRLFEAGADYYVVRSRFHDTLLQTVASMIGPAQP